MNAFTTVAVILGLMMMGVAGCSDKQTSTAKQETTISTPRGQTTITIEKQVEKTGEHHPSSTP